MKARHSVVNPITGGVAVLSLESGGTHGGMVMLKMAKSKDTGNIMFILLKLWIIISSVWCDLSH